MREGYRSGPHPQPLAARWLSIALNRGPLARLLWPLSLLYGALVHLRHWLFAHGVLPTHRLPVPVVVVGNVVLGGAGKTPTTIALVQHLQAQGWRPGVVSRGYGRRHKDLVEVSSTLSADVCGDEPALIHRTTGAPVFVARSRAEAGRALLTTHPDVNVIVCDDGLQHLALERDLAIAVFDDRGTGNGWLLPAGLLREPWPPTRGMQTSSPDLVLQQVRENPDHPPPLAKASTPAFVAVRRLADHAVNAEEVTVPMAQLQGQKLHAVAGIARPEVFFDMLRERGLTLTAQTPLPDHAGPDDYQRLMNASLDPIICTEKDAVKLFALVSELGQSARPVWAVPLELRPEPAFFAAVDALLKNHDRTELRATTPSAAPPISTANR